MVFNELFFVEEFSICKISSLIPKRLDKHTVDKKLEPIVPFLNIDEWSILEKENENFNVRKERKNENVFFNKLDASTPCIANGEHETVTDWLTEVWGQQRLSNIAGQNVPLNDNGGREELLIIVNQKSLRAKFHREFDYLKRRNICLTMMMMIKSLVRSFSA